MVVVKTTVVVGFFVVVVAAGVGAADTFGAAVVTIRLTGPDLMVVLREITLPTTAL